eukprot:gene23027-31340_t
MLKYKKSGSSVLIAPVFMKDQLEELATMKQFTPLANELVTTISVKGPITLHDYMSMALNHPLYGYYHNKVDANNSNDKIGERGDFITAPEVSQLFSECILIWCASVWSLLGCPPAVKIIELGPGKGTLIREILYNPAKENSAISKFREAVFAGGVHLVELSQTMRGMQFAALGCDDGTSGESKESLVKDGQDYYSTNKKDSNGPNFRISWHSYFHQVPSDDCPSLVIGQEFLDTFPVHQFVYTKHGWREKLVDVVRQLDRANSDPQPTSATAPATAEGAGTEAGAAAATEAVIEADEAPAAPKYIFQLVRAPFATPAVKVLLEGPMNATIRSLQEEDRRSLRGETATSSSSSQQLKEGDGLEISPLALATCEDIGRRIASSKGGGAAILIDYGEDFTQVGKVDLTADVDFAACARAAGKAGARPLPVSTQGDFLMRMGIVERAQQLMELDSTTDDQAENLVLSMQKLVDPAEMGRKYKVLALCSPNIEKKLVPGFESFSFSPTQTHEDEAQENSA